jgi:hypothetical protein
LGQPLDGGVQALLSRFFAFSFAQPFDVFLPVAVAEAIESCLGFFISFLYLLWAFFAERR